MYTKDVNTIRDTTVDTSHSSLVQDALNRSVIGYGVKITGIRITNVKLPTGLQNEMTQQTKLAAELKTRAKNHQLSLAKEKNLRLQENKKFERKFEREAAEQKVEVIKESTIREATLQKIRAKAEQEIIAVQTEASAKITAAKGKLRDAATVSQQKLSLIHI